LVGHHPSAACRVRFRGRPRHEKHAARPVSPFDSTRLNASPRASTVSVMSQPPRELPARPVIAIVGAGALGGYYGARLAQHGHNVHFLLRGDYDAIRANGLTVRSCHGNFTLQPSQVQAYRSPADMPKADLVVVTIKTTSNDQVETLVRPLLT